MKSSLGSRTLENNTTGARNTANGVFTLFGNTLGNENTAVGYAALGFNSTGNGNTATGYQALLNNGGNFNTANGYQALFNNIGGSNNTAIGHNALTANTTGSNNVAIGNDASGINETGMENVAIGFNSGPTFGNNDLNNTIAIGSSATVGESSAIAIGNGASATGTHAIAIGGGVSAGNNQVRIGNASVMSIGGVVDWSVVSDGRFKENIQEDIPGLAFITKLRPVSYTLNRAKLQAFLQGEADQDISGIPTEFPERTTGFVAQEVAAALDENDYVFSGIGRPQHEQEHYSIRYAAFVMPLVKGMQEQQQMIEALQRKNETMQQEIDALKGLLYGDTKADEINTKLSGTTVAGKAGFAVYQNIPNPFDKTTSISARIPGTVRQAKIVVYNLNGLELENYTINKRGKVAVEISGSMFPSGMYIYALIADGRIIDTKKMILTK